LNDAKTIIRKRENYETSIGRREKLRQEIAEEVELDLSGIDFGSDYGDADVPPDPDPDEARSVGFLRIIERWQATANDDPRLQALVQMAPAALAYLGQYAGTAANVPTINTCMEMLRTEQTLTPAVAGYIEGALAKDSNATLAALDGLITSTPPPYLTPWQVSWLVPPLARFSAFTTGQGGSTRESWLRSVWEDPRLPETVRAALARPLAARGVVQTTELLAMYDQVSATSRPALAGALGASGLAGGSPEARAITDDDNLNRWMFDAGQAAP
jgi:hypothetical protein